MNVKLFVLYCLSATTALYSSQVLVNHITKLEHYDHTGHKFGGSSKCALTQYQAYINNNSDLVINDVRSKYNGNTYSLSPECLQTIEKDFSTNNPNNDYEIETDHNPRREHLYLRARIALTQNDNSIDPINNKAAFLRVLHEKIQIESPGQPTKKVLRKLHQPKSTTSFNLVDNIPPLLTALSICLILIMAGYRYKK